MRAGSLLLAAAGAVVLAGCVWLTVDGIRTFLRDGES